MLGCCHVSVVLLFPEQARVLEALGSQEGHGLLLCYGHMFVTQPQMTMVVIFCQGSGTSAAALRDVLPSMGLRMKLCSRMPLGSWQLR